MNVGIKCQLQSQTEEEGGEALRPGRGPEPWPARPGVRVAAGPGDLGAALLGAALLSSETGESGGAHTFLQEPHVCW